jgi:hypothetical protein
MDFEEGKGHVRKEKEAARPLFFFIMILETFFNTSE